MTYQCKRCGATSALESLFVVTDPPVKGNDKTCVTCLSYEQRTSSVTKTILGWIVPGLFWGAAFTESVQGTAAFVVAIPLATFLGIFLHELGHAAGATLVGAKVVALSFGSGLQMRVFRWHGRFFLFGPLPIEGMTLVNDVPKRGYRWRMILIFFAGPAANLLLAVLLWRYFVTTESGSETLESVVFLFALINTLLGVFNLVPFGSANQLGVVSSDGRQILQHLGMSNSDITAAAEQVTSGEAYLEWKYGDPVRAARLLQPEIDRDPPDPYMAILGSAVLLDTKRFSEGIQLCERALLQTPIAEVRATLENNLSCLLIRQGDESDLPRIDILTKSALRLMSVSLAVRATRGSYFLRAGRYRDAIALLDDERFVMEKAESQARVSAHLALANFRLGNTDEASSALDRAKQLYPDLDEIADVERAMRQELAPEQV